MKEKVKKSVAKVVILRESTFTQPNGCFWINFCLIDCSRLSPCVLYSS